MEKFNKEELAVIKIALAFLLDTNYGHDHKHFDTRDKLCERLGIVAVTEQPSIQIEGKRTLLDK